MAPRRQRRKMQRKGGSSSSSSSTSERRRVPLSSMPSARSETSRPPEPTNPLENATKNTTNDATNNNTTSEDSNILQQPSHGDKGTTTQHPPDCTCFLRHRGWFVPNDGENGATSGGGFCMPTTTTKA